LSTEFAVPKEFFCHALFGVPTFYGRRSNILPRAPSFLEPALTNFILLSLIASLVSMVSDLSRGLLCWHGMGIRESDSGKTEIG